MGLILSETLLRMHPLIVGLCLFLIALTSTYGALALKTVYLELDGEGRVGYEVCLEYDYGESGSDCMGSETAHTTLERRLNLHTRTAVLIGVVVGGLGVLGSVAQRKKDKAEFENKHIEDKETAEREYLNLDKKGHE